MKIKRRLSIYILYKHHDHISQIFKFDLPFDVPLIFPLVLVCWVADGAFMLVNNKLPPLVLDAEVWTLVNCPLAVVVSIVVLSIFVLCWLVIDRMVVSRFPIGSWLVSALDPIEFVVELLLESTNYRQIHFNTTLINKID